MGSGDRVMTTEERLRAALGRYADHKNWEFATANEPVRRLFIGEAMRPGWEVAEAALGDWPSVEELLEMVKAKDVKIRRLEERLREIAAVVTGEGRS